MFYLCRFTKQSFKVSTHIYQKRSGIENWKLDVLCVEKRNFSFNEYDFSFMK